MKLGILGFVAMAAFVQAQAIVFAAKVNGQLRRLYGQKIDEDNFIMGYGSPFNVSHIAFHDTLAYVEGFEEAFYIGPVDKVWMGYGKTNSAMPFKFDRKKKVKNVKFYACPEVQQKDDNPDYSFTPISLDAKARKGCKSVDVYKILLLY